MAAGAVVMGTAGLVALGAGTASAETGKGPGSDSSTGQSDGNRVDKPSASSGLTPGGSDSASKPDTTLSRASGSSGGTGTPAAQPDTTQAHTTGSSSTPGESSLRAAGTRGSPTSGTAEPGTPGASANNAATDNAQASPRTTPSTVATNSNDNASADTRPAAQSTSAQSASAPTASAQSLPAQTAPVQSAPEQSQSDRPLSDRPLSDRPLSDQSGASAPAASTSGTATQDAASPGTATPDAARTATPAGRSAADDGPAIEAPTATDRDALTARLPAPITDTAALPAPPAVPEHDTPTASTGDTTTDDVPASRQSPSPTLATSGDDNPRTGTGTPTGSDTAQSPAAESPATQSPTGQITTAQAGTPAEMLVSDSRAGDTASAPGHEVPAAGQLDGSEALPGGDLLGTSDLQVGRTTTRSSGAAGESVETGSTVVNSTDGPASGAQNIASAAGGPTIAGNGDGGPMTAAASDISSQTGVTRDTDRSDEASHVPLREQPGVLVASAGPSDLQLPVGEQIHPGAAGGIAQLPDLLDPSTELRIPTVVRYQGTGWAESTKGLEERIPTKNAAGADTWRYHITPTTTELHDGRKVLEWKDHEGKHEYDPLTGTIVIDDVEGSPTEDAEGTPTNGIRRLILPADTAARLPAGSELGQYDRSSTKPENPVVVAPGAARPDPAAMDLSMVDLDLLRSLGAPNGTQQPVTTVDGNGVLQVAPQGVTGAGPLFAGQEIRSADSPSAGPALAGPTGPDTPSPGRFRIGTDAPGTTDGRTARTSDVTGLGPVSDLVGSFIPPRDVIDGTDDDTTDEPAGATENPWRVTMFDKENWPPPGIQVTPMSGAYAALGWAPTTFLTANQLRIAAKQPMSALLKYAPAGVETLPRGTATDLMLGVSPVPEIFAGERQNEVAKSVASGVAAATLDQAARAVRQALPAIQERNDSFWANRHRAPSAPLVAVKARRELMLNSGLHPLTIVAIPPLVGELNRQANRFTDHFNIDPEPTDRNNNRFYAKYAANGLATGGGVFTPIFAENFIKGSLSARAAGLPLPKAGKLAVATSLALGLPALQTLVAGSTTTDPPNKEDVFYQGTRKTFEVVADNAAKLGDATFGEADAADGNGANGLRAVGNTALAVAAPIADAMTNAMTNAGIDSVKSIWHSVGGPEPEPQPIVSPATRELADAAALRALDNFAATRDEYGKSRLDDGVRLAANAVQLPVEAGIGLAHAVAAPFADRKRSAEEGPTQAQRAQERFRRTGQVWNQAGEALNHAVGRFPKLREGSTDPMCGGAVVTECIDPRSLKDDDGDGYADNAGVRLDNTVGAPVPGTPVYERLVREGKAGDQSKPGSAGYGKGSAGVGYVGPALSAGTTVEELREYHASPTFRQQVTDGVAQEKARQAPAPQVDVRRAAQQTISQGARAVTRTARETVTRVGDGLDAVGDAAQRIPGLGRAVGLVRKLPGLGGDGDPNR